MSSSTTNNHGISSRMNGPHHTGANPARNGRGRGRGRSSARGRSGEPPHPPPEGRGQSTSSRGGVRGGTRGGGRTTSGRTTSAANAGRTARTERNGISQGLPSPTDTKINGQKGAAAHTVGESYRIRLTRLLLELRDNNDNGQDILEFPATLTNTERKFVHELAAQLGLSSKSTGQGTARHIVVTKGNKSSQKRNNHQDTNIQDIPVLNVGRKGLEALRRHLQRYPPSSVEDLEAHETGRSLVQAMERETSKQDNNHDAITASLQQILGVSRHDEEPHPVARELHSTLRRAGVGIQQRQVFHQKAQHTKRQHPAYAQMQAQRRQLPAYAHQDEIVRAVADHAVTIVWGETGCGKSTQVPQFILDANPTCRIVVTQPRRISAIALAERVAEEQCQEGGAGDWIGYQVRLESALSSHTQLLFLTPGVLLRQMQSSPQLTEYTHIVMDEVHERDKYQEFLLIVLRDLLPVRPDLRLILMSATLQTMTLVEYFTAQHHNTQPALVEMEGRMFPVQEYFLEQVLEMTGYVDATTGYDGGARVEEELAKWMRTGAYSVGNDNNNQHPTSSTTTMVSNVTLQCAMCGKRGFDDAVELGAHIALCDGILYSEDDEDAVGEQLVDGNAACSTGQQAAAAAETDTNEDKKWDGVSPFDFLVSGGNDEAKNETDVLLDQYQTMHDDETVDNFLLLEVIQYIAKCSYGDGGILVFLPGWQEISEFTNMLEGTSPFCDRSKYLVLPLHSGIPSRDQRRVLQRPPKGVRKIVLSTNIAETSLTIDDISFVVDTGRAKEKNYDPHLKTSTLQSTWISQASAKQRKGRAGRVKAGVCFHLFSSRRHQDMRPFTESELLRTPLEEVCLMCKQLRLAAGGPDDEDGIPAFLEKAMSPPHLKAVQNALDLLVEMGAMRPETNDLTALGDCLAVLSLEPRVGKMVIWSYILGCARVASNFAVAMSYKSPFVLPSESQRKAADQAKVYLSRGSESDQITIHYALESMQQSTNKGSLHDFCRRNFLGMSTMQMISDLRKNLFRELVSLGFPNPTLHNHYHNRHDNDHALWQASIAAGLYPNVAARRRDEVNFSTMNNRKTKVHVSSVNAVRGQPLSSKSQVSDKEIEFVCFGEMTKSTRIFTANNTTHLSSPLPLLLLCGTSLSVRPHPDDEKTSLLNLDDWIMFKCDVDTAASVVILRKRLDAAFWNFVARPSAGMSAFSVAERDAVEIVGPVLQSAHSTAATRRS